MGNNTIVQMKSYNVGQIILHWTIAVLVFYQYALGTTLTDEKLLKCNEVGVATLVCEGFLPQYVVGSMILGLMLVRTFFKLYFGAPPLSDTVPYFFKILAKLSHISLYLLVFAVTITGLLGLFANSSLTLNIHSLISNLLIILILIHICAVAFHEGILGSRLLYRMVTINKNHLS